VAGHRETGILHFQLISRDLQKETLVADTAPPGAFTQHALLQITVKWCCLALRGIQSAISSFCSSVKLG